MASDDAISRVKAIMAKLKDPAKATASLPPPSLPPPSSSSSSSGYRTDYYGPASGSASADYAGIIPPLAPPFTTMTPYEIQRRKDATIRSWEWITAKDNGPQIQGPLIPIKKKARKSHGNHGAYLPTPGLGYVESQKSSKKKAKQKVGYSYTMSQYPRYSTGLTSSTPSELQAWYGLSCSVLTVDFTHNLLTLSSEIPDVKLSKSGNDGKVRETSLVRKSRPYVDLYAKVPVDVREVGVVTLEKENNMGGDYWRYSFVTWEDAYKAEEEIRRGGGVGVERGRREEGCEGREQERGEKDQVGGSSEGGGGGGGGGDGTEFKGKKEGGEEEGEEEKGANLDDLDDFFESLK
ncbi:hypothetical protein TrVE_jg10584 [Triparma verrucosa]|uniref:Uncharacterized protein n=1 Tax=Triparma verrucosa TaxID=1606542 RepID=A0A9W7B9T0_9STRA|nr:hypothetical protein TrVE_jg10584 [Triparma verrucosa]